MVKKLWKDELLRHIREPEKITTLRRILDLPDIASRNYRATASDFLDPYEQTLVASLTGHFPSVESFFLPEENRERKIVVFTPFQVNEDFLSAFYLESSKRLYHRAVLGSLLGLGIERGKIGDIVSSEGKTYVIVKKEIARFLAINFRKIGASTIRVHEIAPNAVPDDEEAWIKSAAIVSSMRLDAVIHAVTHKSRDEVKGLIAKGLVKINFRRVEKAHEMIVAGDLLSVRGFGRIKIFDSLSKTKKGKIRFSYGILDSR